MDYYVCNNCGIYVPNGTPCPICGECHGRIVAKVERKPREVVDIRHEVEIADRRPEEMPRRFRPLNGWVGLFIVSALIVAAPLLDSLISGM